MAPHPARVGIIAADHARIRQIVDDLGLSGANVVRLVAHHCNDAARGHTFDTLLVDEPVAAIDRTDVLPAMHGSTRGRTYIIQSHG